MKKCFGCVVPVLSVLLLIGILLNGYALDCTGSACPECTGDVDAWLAAHPTISRAMIWEDPVAGPLYYSAWPSSRREALITAFQTAWNGGSYGLTDPPLNMLHLGDCESARTVLAEGDAWPLYISSVAHSLALEMGHRVSWSLLDYTDRDLAIFLDSRETFSWSILYQGYVISNYVSPAPPDSAYSFLVNNAIIARDRLSTIVSLLDWSRNNLRHYIYDNSSCPNPNVQDTLLMNWTWQHRGLPPVSRIITGTTDQQTKQFAHWTWGCGGTTGFLRAVLRAVNIPVTNEISAGHSQTHFTSEGLYLSHGDDPYSIRSMPEIPTERLLIDQKTFDAWFGPNVAPERIKNNVGRQTLKLAIEYLPKSLLTKYCLDRSKGLSHAEGAVYSSFQPCYSLAELEKENLWGRMDAKFSPIITTITPTIVQKGSSVFVHGANLCSRQCRKSHSTETEVRLNGVRDPLTPLWVDKEFLYFQVPGEATSGHLTITTRTAGLCGGSAESPETLTILDGKNKCTNKNCDDGNLCTIDSCDAATGKCLHVKDTWTCDDGNVCTTDSCIPATGKCIHKNNTEPCDDGNYCTVNDVCSNGRCKGTAGNDGKPCDDGNACTTGDICSRGVCKGTARKCDDNNACTIDTCNTKTGACVYTTAYTPMECNDFDPCTTDTCNASTGCVHTDNGTCGSDCGINSFTVSPAVTTTCAKTDPLFTIKVKNYKGKDTSGTITLYADAAVAQTWSDVSIPAGKVVTRKYLYASRAHDGGKTVTWTATVTTPNDSNSANDSKSLAIRVTKCSN